MGKLFGEGRRGPEDKKLMSSDTTKLHCLGTGIKGGTTIENGAVRRKYFQNIF